MTHNESWSSASQWGNRQDDDELYVELDRLSVKYNTSIADVIWAASGELNDSNDARAQALKNEARVAIERDSGPISDSLIEDLLESYVLDEDDE